MKSSLNLFACVTFVFILIKLNIFSIIIGSIAFNIFIFNILLNAVFSLILKRLNDSNKSVFNVTNLKRINIMNLIFIFC